MTLLFSLVRRESVWPLVIAALAVLLLLPNLDGYGFWEPHEIKVADRAQEVFPAEPDDSADDPADPDGAQPGAGASEGAPGAKSETGGRAQGKASPKANAGDKPNAKAGDKPNAKAGDKPKAGAEDAEPEPERSISAELGQPPFHHWVIARGMRLFGGDKEIGARLPLALLGVFTVLATFFLGRRLAGPRAGLLAGLVLLAFPLLLMQSRQLSGQIGAMLGQVVAILGLVGLAWPAAGRTRMPLWRYPLDLSLAALGAIIGYYAAGLLAGVVVPFGAVGITCVVGYAIADKPDPRDRRWARMHLATGAVVGLGVAAVGLGLTLAALFDLSPPIPGQRALFGYSLVTNHLDYLPELGGKWLPSPRKGVSFDSLFEQIGYGAFPWSALVPIAMLQLAMGARRGRRAWAGTVPLAWAVLAWGVSALLSRHVGSVLYPAVPAMAVAVGMWLHYLLSAREQADATCDSNREASRGFGIALRVPLVALFAALAALVMSKDVQGFPDQLSSLIVLDGAVKYPDDTRFLKVDIKRYWIVFGALFGFAIGAGLWLWERCKKLGERRRPWYLLGRYGIRVALAVGLLFALFIVHAWIPTLSQKMSSKHLYAAYDQRRAGDEPLGVLGNPGGGLDYYASGAYERIKNRNELVKYLETDQRVFALAPASDLCDLHRRVKGKYDYYVLDNSHAKYLLLSNQLEAEAPDLNPLNQAIVRERPANITTPLKVDFDGRVELVGFDMPAEVKRGSSFEMTLYFKVLRPLRGSWKIFLHFDGGGLRFQGDHEPIDGRCSTSFWQAGDYIVDTFKVDAGNLTFARTDYTLYAGFFKGSAGNWTNMKIVSAEDGDGEELKVDGNNRANIGRIRLR